MIVLPQGRVPDLSAPDSLAGIPIGIVYATTPEDSAARLLIVDPVWQKALPAQWTYMFPRRLAHKFGDEAFERRIVLSAEYLSKVFRGKIALVLKPRGGRLNDESL